MQRIEVSRHYRVPVERAYGFIIETRNWSRFFPGFVALDPKSRWSAPGDTAWLTTRLLGRQRGVTLTLERMQPNSSLSYTSRQDGLPDAHHERTFIADQDGVTFNLLVAYEARGGLPGLMDRTVVKRGVRRLLQRTLDALEVEFA